MKSVTAVIAEQYCEAHGAYIIDIMSDRTSMIFTISGSAPSTLPFLIARDRRFSAVNCEWLASGAMRIEAECRK